MSDEFKVGDRVVIPPGTTEWSIESLHQEEFRVGGVQWVAYLKSDHGDRMGMRVSHLQKVGPGSD